MKKFFIALLILILLPILTVGIFILTFDLNRYREFTEKKLSETLNYPVSIGAMETKLAFVPTIQITDFKIMNQDKKPILTIPKMEGTLEIIPLLKKQVNVPKILVPALFLDLTQLPKKQDGTSPAAPATTNSKDNKPTFTPELDLSQLLWIKDFQVKKLNVIYPIKDKDQSITVEDFSLTDMSSFTLKINYLKNKFDVSGSMGMLTKLLGKSPLVPIKLNVKTKSVSFSCNGQIKDLTKMEGIRLDLNLTAGKLSEVLNIFGTKSDFNFNTHLRISVDGNLKNLNLKKIDFSVGNKELVLKGEGTLKQIASAPVLNLKLTNVLTSGKVGAKLNLAPFEMSEQIEFSNSKLSIKNIKYLANKSDMMGTIYLDLKKKPLSIQFDLKSSYLSLNDIFYQSKKSLSKQAPLAQKKKALIPEFNLPWDALNQFDLSGNLQIQKILFSNKINDFATLNIQPKLEKGTLVSPVQMRFLSGTIKSVLWIDQKEKKLQVKAKLENLNLNKVSPIHKELENAVLYSDFVLQSQGKTVKEILAQSEGKIALEILDGKITNQWFNTLAESFSSKKKMNFTSSETPITLLCGVINLPIKKGILTSQDKIVLQTDVLNLIVNGTFNLNNETMEITLVPSLPSHLQSGKNLTDLMKVVQLKGPWTEPKITINTQKVLSDLINLTLNKTIQNKEGQTQEVSPTALCQKALGRQLSRVKKSPKVNRQTYHSVERPEEKVDLKKQLLNSLSQVLKKQGT